MRYSMLFAAALLSGVSAFAIAPAHAGQNDQADQTAPKRHHRHAATGSDRLDLLEHQVELQSQAIKAQSDAI